MVMSRLFWPPSTSSCLVYYVVQNFDRQEKWHQSPPKGLSFGVILPREANALVYWAQLKTNNCKRCLDSRNCVLGHKTWYIGWDYLSEMVVFRKLPKRLICLICNLWGWEVLPRPSLSLISYKPESSLLFFYSFQGVHGLLIILQHSKRFKRLHTVFWNSPQL